MTINEWIIESDMYEFSKERYNTTKVLGEISLLETAINSYELINSYPDVLTEGVELVDVFSEAGTTSGSTVTSALSSAKDSLVDKVKYMWKTIWETIKKAINTVINFFAGADKKITQSQESVKTLWADIDNLSKSVSGVTLDQSKQDKLVKSYDTMSQHFTKLDIKRWIYLDVKERTFADILKSLSQKLSTHHTSATNSSGPTGDRIPMASVVDTIALPVSFEYMADAFTQFDDIRDDITNGTTPNINALKTTMSKISKDYNIDKGSRIGTDSAKKTIEELKKAQGSFTNIKDPGNTLQSHQIKDLNDISVELMNVCSDLIKDFNQHMKDWSDQLKALRMFVNTVNQTIK